MLMRFVFGVLRRRPFLVSCEARSSQMPFWQFSIVNCTNVRVRERLPGCPRFNTLPTMGVGKICSTGPLGVFSKIFPLGQSGEICFFRQN